MVKYSLHAEWLQLVDISGPFLAVSVLEEVFPMGLDAVYSDSRSALRNLWKEINEAEENGDPYLDKLNAEWVRRVLSDFLEYPEDWLVPGADFHVKGDQDLGTYSPNWTLMINETPALFIGVFPPGTSLTSALKPNSADWTASPLDKMTKLCRAYSVRLGLLTNGEQWMLVNAPVGEISGAASWYARLWFQEPKSLQAFSTLLGIRRFTCYSDETLPALLDRSRDALQEVTDTLGAQVRAAVEVLIQGIDLADANRNRELLKNVSPTELYEAGLTVMMRLVFLLCAEERGLILDGNEIYDQYYAVSTLRRQLNDEANFNGQEVLRFRCDAWPRLLALFRAIYAGVESDAMHIPALGGSIFDPDRYPFLEGRPHGTSWREMNPQPLPIDNQTVLLLLNSLQVLEHPAGAIHLSYRALDVEQIGHIYEGLLEHTAQRVPENVVILGLKGSVKAKNPYAELAELESLALDSENDLLEYVTALTGRSRQAVKNDLQRSRDAEQNPAVRQTLLNELVPVCGDDKLVHRILPFAFLLRKDAWGKPVVYLPGSFMVTLGQDRRDTGTHYTPKAMTEKIVERTLDPIVTPIKNSPQALLSLKICDPAMGSGAFLVQVCRYLAVRLREAWNQAEKEGKFIDSRGVVHDTPPTEPMTNLPDERLIEARRLIAEKCLYGVDINPLAVELAKLSIWLVTISKGKPFAFLDHNLKSGDSLLGVRNIEQLIQFRMNFEKEEHLLLFGSGIQDAVNEAIALRQRLVQTKINDIQDVHRMEDLHSAAQSELRKCRVLADYFIGNVLVTPMKKLQEYLDRRSFTIDVVLNGTEDDCERTRIEAQKLLNTDLPPGKPHRHPFHWALEFPEVFQAGGFDAICGNPPFSGGQHLTGTLGTAYRNYLVNHIADETKGSADLVAYFYLNAFRLLKPDGIFGLIACNTIAEGDTRQVGLERILKQGGTIIAANPNVPWSGTAAVVVSLVFVAKTDHWNGLYFLNDEPVEKISAFLSSEDEWTPKVLKANENQSFQGSIVLGLGFTMSEEEAQAYIGKDPKNAEVLFPYLSGVDNTTSPTQQPSRWVINFWDWPLDRKAPGHWETADSKKKKEFLASAHVPKDYPGRVAADFPELLEILEEKVKPERDRNNRACYRDNWWQYAEKRPAFYHVIGRGSSFVKHPAKWETIPPIKTVLFHSFTGKYVAFSLVPDNYIYAGPHIVICRNKYSDLAILQSNLYVDFVWRYASKMKRDLRFVPSDCYETFPFPVDYDSRLETLGEEYDALRRAIMVSEEIGLTKLYNRFHTPEERDPRFERLRELQREIDEAVLRSYGWEIPLDHGFHHVPYLPAKDSLRYTISDPARLRILRHLSRLNHERWEEEEKERTKV
ncbi:MAG: N-6 DNA methylase [Thermoguttaceae bacterium]|nr:N-6 DNA methylase [Thermoguttaceae bacterium]